MALRIAHAAFVAEHRSELAGDQERVGHLLREPPGVLAEPAVVVVATAGPVHVGGVDEVAPGVDDVAVIAAVAADRGVPVELPAQQPQLLGALRRIERRAVVAHHRHLRFLRRDVARGRRRVFGLQGR